MSQADTLPILKKEALANKIQLKNLREKPKIKLVESSDDSDEDYFTKKNLINGTKWWRRIDRHYFKDHDIQHALNIKYQTTSQQLLHIIDPIILHKYNYFDKVLASQMPSLLNSNTLRILFQKQSSQGISYRFSIYQPVNIQQAEQDIQLDNKTAIYHISPFNNRIQSKQIEQQPCIKTLSLQQIQSSDDPQFIYKCLHYERVSKLPFEQKQKQLMYWEQQLRIEHQKNQDNWDQIIKRIKKHKIQEQLVKKTLYISPIQKGGSASSIETQVKIENLSLKKHTDLAALEIKKYLFWSQILKSVQVGHIDKTDFMLDQVLETMQINDSVKKKKSKHQNLKASFETDCKVCFSTENLVNNKVLYCDGCNTSFHQSCYGVQKISKDQPFFCDTCLYIRQTMDKTMPRPKKLLCQICLRPKFPLKEVNGHFYHLTCLFLFNLAQVKDFKIKLKPNLTHQDIVDKVIDNELHHSYCQYCISTNGSELGMQFQCSNKNCNKTYHPICAYLNGCFFQIKKNGHSLDVRVQCSEHLKDRDHLNQIYLRRFFCDFRNTSKLSEQEFRKSYNEEVIERQQSQFLRMEKENEDAGYKKGQTPWNYICPIKIITPTKIVSHYLRRANERNDGANDISLKKTVTSNKKKPLKQQINQNEAENELKTMMKSLTNNQSSFSTYSQSNNIQASHLATNHYQE